MDYISIGIIAWAVVATVVCYGALKALYEIDRALGAHLG